MAASARMRCCWYRNVGSEQLVRERVPGSFVTLCSAKPFEDLASSFSEPALAPT